MKYLVLGLLLLGLLSRSGYVSCQESDLYSDSEDSGNPTTELPELVAYDIVDPEITESSADGDHMQTVDNDEDIVEIENESDDTNGEEVEDGSGEALFESISENTTLDEEDEEDEEEEEEEQSTCKETEFGCCTDARSPAHGPNMEGCCLTTEFGCCPDNRRPAGGLDSEGCGCESSLFGCCPDQKTARTGEGELDGCGCTHTEFGCCQDQHTTADGPNHEGCPCWTFDYGCCEDGNSVAQGPNKEGCPGCESSEYGCCPDQFTAAQGEDNEGCDCAGSEFGCCPDGINHAEGLEFEGCPTKPGEACFLKAEKGTCEDFSVQWYFDNKEGRCSRFWYGGCEGNLNRFDDASTCEETCVNPPGSGRCYLPKVEGICTGDYERYYYDHNYKQCIKFKYGGCLGNANNFMSKLECDRSCVRSDDLAICEQSVEPGPCMGNYTRWYYDEETGECELFAYGGCHGNKNRFESKEECDNSCMHKKMTMETNQKCKQDIDIGKCNETQARWAFDSKQRKCVPFYFSGCEGNSNNFATIEECNNQCPDAFPPEMEVVNKILNKEEGTQVVLEIQVEGNPFPDIIWQHESQTIQEEEGRFSLREDRSLVIEEISMEDAGSWMVIADNGLGKVARKQISVSVYPSQIPITVEIPLESKEFETGQTIRLECKAEGFPIPSIQWLKNNARLPKSTRIYVEDEKTLVVERASPIDGGVYICRATNENMQNQAAVDITVLQGEVPIQCQDQPKFANCALIVKAKYCAKNENLAKLCCKSCVESGQIAGPPA